MFELALNEQGVYTMFEAGPTSADFTKVFHAGNHDLAGLLYNYIKANTIHKGLVSESYLVGGMQQFLRGDALSVKLFQMLSKMQSPLAKEFFEERTRLNDAFDLALKKEGFQ